MGVTRNAQQTRRNDGKRHTKHTTTKMMYATVLFGVMLSCATAKKVLYHEFMGAQASTEAMIADYKPSGLKIRCGVASAPSHCETNNNTSGKGSKTSFQSSSETTPLAPHSSG